MRSPRRHLPGFWLLAIGLRAVLVPALCIGQTPQNRTFVQSVLVPDVQGMPFGEASNILERLGLRAEQLRRIENEARAGIVVRQDPQPKTRVARGSTVQLTVSTGRPAPDLRMPDLFGMMPAQANALLGRIKMHVEPSGTAPSPQPTGTIVS